MRSRASAGPVLMFLLIGGVLLAGAAAAQPADEDPEARDDATEARVAAQEAERVAHDARQTADEALETALEARQVARDASQTANLTRIEVTRLSQDLQAQHDQEGAMVLGLLAAGVVAVGLAAFRLSH